MERQKIAYICSPYRADTKEKLEEHIKYAKTLSRKYVLLGYSVITPHLYYTNFLDDNDAKERKLGLSSALNLLEACDVIVVGYRFGRSVGMVKELEKAWQLKKEIIEEDTLPKISEWSGNGK